MSHEGRLYAVGWDPLLRALRLLLLDVQNICSSVVFDGDGEKGGSRAQCCCRSWVSECSRRTLVLRVEVFNVVIFSLLMSLGAGCLLPLLMFVVETRGFFVSYRWLMGGTRWFASFAPALSTTDEERGTKNIWMKKHASENTRFAVVSTVLADDDIFA